MSRPAFDLTSRVALVTGASSGLGAHFARVLAHAGAAVVVAARRADRLEDLRKEIERSGGRALAVEMDVSNEPSTIRAFDQAEMAFGPVTSVIANAGVNVEAPALDLSVEAFDHLFAVNVRGVFLTAREGARRMIAHGAGDRGDGRIVLISSITADKVTAGLAPYSASKAALSHLGRGLARDWVRKGINVNMILPGYVRTEINGGWFEGEAGERRVSAFPRRRLLDGHDLDAMLLYLSSDASAGVTGASFTIDDGQSL